MSKKPTNTWEGIFDSWRSAKSSESSWASERWKNRVIDQLKVYDSEKLNDIVIHPPRPSNLSTICSLIKPKKIIDFGGSSGWLWLHLKESINTEFIESYTIIENNSVCEFCSPFFKDEPKINFSTIENFEEECDLLYFNSVIQYMSDRDFFGALRKYSPDYLLIDDLLAGQFEDFYSLQIYYEDRIPVKFRNYSKFIEKLKDNYYNILLTKTYVASNRGKIRTLPMNNFPKKNTLNYTLTILLEKTSRSFLK